MVLLFTVGIMLVHFGNMLEQQTQNNVGFTPGYVGIMSGPQTLLILLSVYGWDHVRALTFVKMFQPVYVGITFGYWGKLGHVGSTNFVNFSVSTM